MTVVYNNLNQQAFVNVYLDSNPQYVELMYIDMWQQTHEASIYVEEKDNEVTVRGKINSPALDENFIIVTVGNNNDKFDLNLNDGLIVTAFKDDNIALLDMHFGNDYKLSYKTGNEVGISLVSPKAKASLSFSLKRIDRTSFLEASFDSDMYHLVLEVNKRNIFKVVCNKDGENVLESLMEYENTDDFLQLQFQWDVVDSKNMFIIKHTFDPVLLNIQLNSPSFLKNNVEIVLGMKNDDIISGILEVNEQTPLFRSHVIINKEKKTIEISFEAPLFSRMDSAKIEGIFNVLSSWEYEVNVSATLLSEDKNLAHTSAYLIKNEETFTTGFTLESIIKDYEDLEVSLYLPGQLASDLKGKIITRLPFYRPFEFGFTVCFKEDGVVGTALAKWQDNIISGEYKQGKTPFYRYMFEWNLQCMETKLHIGAWTKPKEPLTDYIYFIDINNNRIIEVSHALVLKQNHYKSKLIVETDFKGREKYGIDLELQNSDDLKDGKVIRILASAPRFGKDLGIDFGYKYHSLLDYTVLAQLRVPYNNKTKMARLHSHHQIQPHINFILLNTSLEYTDIGKVGWELESYGSGPLSWNGEISVINFKGCLNNNVYSLKTKSLLQTNKIQLEVGLETPFDQFQNGELQFLGLTQIIGSELVFSLNSNELININITEDDTNTKKVVILTKWRSLALQYLYEVHDGISVSGYVCWDLFKKDTSQLGASVIVGRDSPKYESVVELILPSEYFPKIGVKTVFENNEGKLFTLLKIDFPSLLVLEGKFADEVAIDRQQSGLQLQWTTRNSEPKNFGLFYASEQNYEESKLYFTIQHFALENDIMLTTYARSSLYGLNVQYSPLKEDEITMEFGYWLVKDDDSSKQESGVKFVAIHPASNTLVNGVANITSTADYTDAGLAVSYLPESELSRVKYVEVFVKRNKKVPEVFVGCSSNGNNIAVGASMWKKENYLQGITLQAKINQKDPLQLELIQNTVDLGVEAEIRYGMSRSYRASAGMPSGNEITAKLTHTMYGKPNLDALASLRLNSSKLLWGRFEFRPVALIGQEFYSGFIEEYADVTLVSEAITKGFSDFFHEDFSKKVILLLNAVSSQSDLVISQTYLELGAIHNCFDNIRILAVKAYELDHLYLKTFHLHIKQAALRLHSYTSCAAEVVTNVFKSLFSPIWSVVQRVSEVLQSVTAQWKVFFKEIGVGSKSALTQMTELVTYYQTSRANFIHQAKLAVAHVRRQLSTWERQTIEWLSDAEVKVNQLCEAVAETYMVYVQRVVEYRDTLIAGFSILGDTVEGMLEIVRDGVYRIREVRLTLQWVVKCVDVVNSWFTNFRVETYVRELEVFVERVTNLIASDVKKNFGEYEIYIQRANMLLDGQYEELNQVPEVLYIKTTISRIYQKLKWFWNYANLSEKLKDEIQKYVQNVRDSLENLENQLDRGERKLRSEYVYVARNNSFTFTQELPFEWPAFNQLPQYNPDLSSSPMRYTKYDYDRLVQMLLPLKQPLLLLPPLSAQALMTTDSFITFDDSFYKFAGDCNSYLLASDLYHKTFSLIANYDQKNKRDLVLYTNGLEITLKNNLEVYVNGKREDLPVKLTKQLTLERRVHSVMIKSKQGFMLECSSFQDMCRFELDWWYMGKTAGLLGTYNYEPSDDFISPNRQQSENIKQFTDSWAVDSNSCESGDEISSSVEDIRPYESMCEMFFSSRSSPFVPCFDVVNSNPFYDMCMAGAKESTCSAVFAYLTKCTSSGVVLGWIPEFCVDSSIPDATLLSGYSDIIEIPSRMSADVVIVAEQAECVKSLQLDSVLSGLKRDLQARDLTDNQFALVTFSGQENQLRTIKGKIWTDSETQLTKTISQLGVDPSDKDASAHLTPALDLAASLPFRPGVSKLVILLHCSGCPAESTTGALMARYTEGNIALHVLQQSGLAGRRGKVLSKAIGLEKSGAYPRRIVKGVPPSMELLQQVSVPQDQCTSLVLNTNGTLFSMEVSKKGLKVWTGRVAQGAVPSSSWQQCENSVGPDNVPVWRCRPTSQQAKLKDYDQTSLDEYMDSSRGAELFSEYEEADR